MSQDEMIFRLILAAFFGGFIGIEREVSHRPAGLRTHILVSVGSALIMILSFNSFSGGDPARLAAQVVSGIGFLGAGTILRQGNEVSGLTTAASLWVSAGIGLAVGAGEYKLAGITVIIVLFSLVSLGFMQKQIIRGKYNKIVVECSERIGLLGDIGQTIGSHSIVIHDIKSSKDTESMIDAVKVRFYISIAPPPKYTMSLLADELKALNGVLSVEQL